MLKGFKRLVQDHRNVCGSTATTGKKPPALSNSAERGTAFRGPKNTKTNWKHQEGRDQVRLTSESKLESLPQCSGSWEVTKTVTKRILVRKLMRLQKEAVSRPFKVLKLVWVLSLALAAMVNVSTRMISTCFLILSVQGSCNIYISKTHQKAQLFTGGNDTESPKPTVPPSPRLLSCPS